MCRQILEGYLPFTADSDIINVSHAHISDPVRLNFVIRNFFWITGYVHGFLLFQTMLIFVLKYIQTFSYLHWNITTNIHLLTLKHHHKHSPTYTETSPLQWNIYFIMSAQFLTTGHHWIIYEFFNSHNIVHLVYQTLFTNFLNSQFCSCKFQRWKGMFGTRLTYFHLWSFWIVE